MKTLSYEIVPIKINLNYQPVPMPKVESDKFRDYIQSLSESIDNNRQNLDSEEYEKYYLNKLADVSNRERKLSHQFWKKNIFKYPLFLVPQYIFEILKRRCVFLNRR